MLKKLVVLSPVGRTREECELLNTREEIVLTWYCPLVWDEKDAQAWLSSHHPKATYVFLSLTIVPTVIPAHQCAGMDNLPVLIARNDGLFLAMDMDTPWVSSPLDALFFESVETVNQLCQLVDSDKYFPMRLMKCLSMPSLSKKIPSPSNT